jgi:hypothetical protein
MFSAVSDSQCLPRVVPFVGAATVHDLTNCRLDSVPTVVNRTALAHKTLAPSSIEQWLAFSRFWIPARFDAARPGLVGTIFSSDFGNNEATIAWNAAFREKGL